MKHQSRETGPVVKAQDSLQTYLGKWCFNLPASSINGRMEAITAAPKGLSILLFRAVMNGALVVIL
jgi:hypothetical protein